MAFPGRDLSDVSEPDMMIWESLLPLEHLVAWYFIVMRHDLSMTASDTQDQSITSTRGAGKLFIGVGSSSSF
jgi:hypothetical protein